MPGSRAKEHRDPFHLSPAYLGSPEDKQGWSRKVQETSPHEPISDTLAHKPSQPLEAGTYEEGKALSQVRVLCSGTEGRK